jgi:hypothetical protein
MLKLERPETMAFVFWRQQYQRWLWYALQDFFFRVYTNVGIIYNKTAVWMARVTVLGSKKSFKWQWLLTVIHTSTPQAYLSWRVSCHFYPIANREISMLSSAQAFCLQYKHIPSMWTSREELVKISKGCFLFLSCDYGTLLSRFIFCFWSRDSVHQNYLGPLGSRDCLAHLQNVGRKEGIF